MAQFNWQRKDVETKVMRGLEAERPDPKTSNVHIFFATDTDKIYILNEEGAWDVFDVAPTTPNTLTVKTTNNAVTVSDVAEIRVPPSRLSTPSSGVAQINIPDDYALTVRTQDNTTNVGSVSELRFSDNTVTDLGSGRVSIAIPQPFNLTVRTQSSSPAYGNVNTLVVPNNTLSQPNPNEALIDIPPALTVREADNNPSVVRPTELVFPNGTLSNPSSGVVEVSIPPADARYVVAESTPALANSVHIPGLRGSADRRGAGFSSALTFQQEFDSNSTGIQVLGTTPFALRTNDPESYLYAESNFGACYLYFNWSPSGDFDARAKLSAGRNGASTNTYAGLSIRNTADDRELMLEMNAANLRFAQRSGTTVTQISAMTFRASYVRITRLSSAYLGWFSDDGIAWVLLGSTTTLSMTVSRIGVHLGGSNLILSCDWIRASG